MARLPSRIPDRASDLGLAPWPPCRSRSSPPIAPRSAASPTAAPTIARRRYAVIDEAYIAHVGFVVDGEPRVLPMTYGRDGDVLYLHGAVGNAMLRGVGRRGGVRHHHAPRRPGARPLRVPPLDELPVGRAARRGAQGGGRGGEAPRLRRASSSTCSPVAPRWRDRPTTRSCARRSCSRSRSRRAPPRCAPAARSTTRRTWTSPVWAGVVPLRLVPGEPEQDPPRRPTCRCRSCVGAGRER